MDGVDCVIIGAGVVGIAVARALALAGHEVVVIERERGFGSGTSSRNSEVIHAGIYYPPGSLKARLCVAGRDRLYAFCKARGVAHRRCGKLIVAADEAQRGELGAIAANAAANGVEDLNMLDAARIRALEPEVAGVAALLSPSTGIVDSHTFMTAMIGEAEANGALFAYRTEVERIERRGDSWLISVAGVEGPVLSSRKVVNAAGLDAASLAGLIEGLPASDVPPLFYAKGNYFALEGRSPFSRLVYPVPEPGGLGVHATIDLGGQVRFGPDVEYCGAVDYGVDERRSAAFYAAIRAYWPGLRDGSLRPDFSGVRPKLSGPGEAAADFMISGPADHGLPGLVNLFGIESPGLTASLAIADEVVARLKEFGR
jgi:L-2-hydroxyglutarate oxidase LhgO